MMIRIPQFRRIDDGTDRYEAVADDGARLIVTCSVQWGGWFWRVEREGATVAAGGASDLCEAQERAISAWLTAR